MRHIYLSFLLGIFALSAVAQSHTANPSKSLRPLAPMNHTPDTRIRTRHSNDRTTSSIFMTESFGSGSATSLPTGWTAGSNSTSALTWMWHKTGDGDAFGIGPILSTTASDGFMIYNADTITLGCSCVASGWLQSPAYNCSAHSSVILSFEEYLKTYMDTFVVWVGTDSTFALGTYQSFMIPGTRPVGYDYWSNQFIGNPYTMHINISSAAANKPNVYIRYVYYGTQTNGYSWMIDDMTLSEAYPVDLSLDKTYFMYSSSSYGWEFYSAIPYQLMDTIYAHAFVNNLGQSDATNDTINAKVYKGSTVVYNENKVLPNASVNGYDSIVAFSGTCPGFYTTDTGSYMLVCSIVKAGDGDATNNTDTFRFAITDNYLDPNPSRIANQDKTFYDAYVSLSGNHNMASTNYTIALNKSDTLSSVTVRLDTVSTVGQIIGVQIYKGFVGYKPTYLGSTEFRAITPTDLSSGNAVFMVDSASSPIVVSGGTSGGVYWAVVKCQACTGDVVLAATSDYTYMTYYGGFYDWADPCNDGDTTHLFMADSVDWYADSYQPMISLNFMNPPTAIRNVNNMELSVGSPYPNPAADIVSIPVNSPIDIQATFTVSNELGNLVEQQTISLEAGRTNNVKLHTGNLPDGVYIYIMETLTGKVAGKFTVVH